MKICFSFRNGISRQSPEFSRPSQEILDSFWDEYLGGADQDQELLWCADVSEDDGTILVHWYEEPRNAQKIIDEISRVLSVSIPGYSAWKTVEQSEDV